MIDPQLTRVLLAAYAALVNTLKTSGLDAAALVRRLEEYAQILDERGDSAEAAQTLRVLREVLEQEPDGAKALESLH